MADLYRYYNALGLNPKYASKKRKQREAFMLKSIDKRTDRYEEVLKYGIDHKIPITILSKELPEIIAKMEVKLKAEWEFREGYKYHGEEKEIQWQKYLKEVKK